MYPEPASREAQLLVAEIDRAQREAADRAESAALGWLQLCMGVLLCSLVFGYLQFNRPNDGGSAQMLLIPAVLVFSALLRGARDRLACIPYPLGPRGWRPIGTTATVLTLAVWIAFMIVMAVSIFGHLWPWLVWVFAALAGSAGFVPGLAALHRAGTLRATWSSQPRGRLVHAAGLAIAAFLALSVAGTGADESPELLLGQLIPMFGFVIWGVAYETRWGPSRVGALWRGDDWAAFIAGTAVLVGSVIATGFGAHPGLALRLGLAALAALPLTVVNLWELSRG